MKTISLGRYGPLRFARDHWACRDAPTPIGAVDVDVDTDCDLPADTSNTLITTLDRIEQIHSLAEAYFQEHAPEDFARAQPLRAPSLVFRHDRPPGTFTIFYSGADEDDTTCYGVEFREFSPFDLVIGD